MNERNTVIFRPGDVGIIIILVIGLIFVQSGCASSSNATSLETDMDKTSLKRLTRENEELKTKIDDLQERVIRLSRLVDDHQVKLDYLADRMHTIETQSSGSLDKGMQFSIDKKDAESKQTKEKESATINIVNPPSKANIEPGKLYDQAHNDYREGRYQEAIIAFKEYLMLFPNSSRANNAQYWIGECYYSLKEFKNALQAFQLVLQNYPISSKIPDAMVKKGMCYLELGKKELAEVEFQQIIDQFPSTNAADIARNKLGN